MYNIILIEDSEKDIIKTGTIINNWSLNKKTSFHNFTSIEAFYNYLQDQDINSIDLFILDIELKDSQINGIRFAEILRKHGYHDDQHGEYGTDQPLQNVAILHKCSFSVKARAGILSRFAFATRSSSLAQLSKSE